MKVRWDKDETKFIEENRDKGVNFLKEAEELKRFTETQIRNKLNTLASKDKREKKKETEVVSNMEFVIFMLFFFHGLQLSLLDQK